MTDNLEGQMSLFDLDSSFLRTYQESSLPIRAETSSASSRKSQGSQNRNAPMCLCMTRAGSGQQADVSTMKWVDGALLGEYMTDSFGVQPKRLMDECLTGERRNGEAGLSHEGSERNGICVDGNGLQRPANDYENKWGGAKWIQILTTWKLSFVD